MPQLGADRSKVQVLFVTLDPQRDTPALLHDYAPAFDPSFIGLTGEAGAISAVAKEFKVFYQKVKGSAPDRYMIDHSASTYAYDVKGRLRLVFRPGVAPEKILEDVGELLNGR